MTKEEMITEIYKEIADKTRAMGCLVGIEFTEGALMEYGRDENAGGMEEQILVVGNEGETIGDDFSLVEEYYKECNKEGWNEELEMHIEKIGHPIMIGDVFSRIETELDDDFGYIIELYNLREYKREPIEKQSKECVLFIYELICTTTTNE